MYKNINKLNKFNKFNKFNKGYKLIIKWWPIDEII